MVAVRYDRGLMYQSIAFGTHQPRADRLDVLTSIRRLAADLKLPAEVLIKPYKLRRHEELAAA